MDMEGESKERHNRDSLMSNLNRRFQPRSSTIKKELLLY